MTCAAYHAAHRACSICDNDYATRYVCEACRRDPANDEWVNESRLAGGGFELDELEAGAQTLPRRGRLWRGRTRNDTDAARMVTRLIAEGKSISQAAKEAGVSERHVSRIKREWSKHLPIPLKGLKDRERK